MKKIFTLCALCAIAGNAAAFAIEENGAPDSTLSAPSTKLSGKLSRKEIYSLNNRLELKKNSPVAIEVITSQDIENQNSPVISTLLNQISGVTVQQNGSIGDQTSFRIRGTDRVRVTIDGIRSDTPNDNKFYLQNYMSDDIERIEIVKGPSGNMGGTQASGGLIGMFTKRGYGDPTLKLQSDFGGYGTFRERAVFSGGNEENDFYLSTTFLKTGSGLGYDNGSGHLTRLRNDDYRNFNVVGNFARRFLEGKAEVRNISRLSTARKGVGYNGSPGYYAQDNNDYSKNLNFANTSIFNYAPNEWYDSSTRFGLYTNTNDFFQFQDNPSNPFASKDYNDGYNFWRGTRLNLASQHNFNYKDINTFSIGYNMEYERYSANSWYGEADYGGGYIEPATKDKYWGSSVQNDVYANDSINIKDILFLRGGARFSHNSLFGNFVSPNASAAIVLPTLKISGAKTKFRGSWGRAANTPSFYQRFGVISGMQLQNPNLKKEEFEGWDAGIEQSFFDERLSFDFGFFSNKYKDYINWNDGWPGMYINVDNARIKGYETSINWRPNEKFRTSLNYTYTDSEDKKTGNELAATPKNRLNATVYYTPSERLTLYTSLGATTNRVYNYDYYTKAPNRVGGFVDVSLGGKVKVYENERTKVFLSAQIFNLLNQKISMYKGMYHPGISCLVGLNLEFKSRGKFL